jgi:hypothetical protein
LYKTNKYLPINKNETGYVPFAMCSDNVETLKKSLEIWKTESVT